MESTSPQPFQTQPEPLKAEPEPEVNPDPSTVCSNCCDPLSTEATSDADTHKAVYQVLEGQTLVQISLILNRVLKLSHLKEAFLDEGLEPDIPLCPSCASILGHLNTLYTEFFKAQRLESYLSKKIERLDELIRRNVSVVEVQPEIEFDDTISNPDSFPIDQSSETLKTPETKQNKALKGIKRKVSSPEKPKTGPWVVVTRLSPKEIKKANVTLSPDTKKSLQTKSFGSDSFDVSSDPDFGPQTDPDFDFKSSAKKRKLSKAKSSVSKASATLNKASKKRLAKELSETSTSQPSEACNDEQSPRINIKVRRGEFFKRKLLHPFPCIYCPSDFDTETERIDHLKETHCEATSVVCGPCGKVFSKESVKKKHLPKCGWVPPDFHPPPYICEKCGKEFETWLSLSGHVKQVCTDRRFYCDQCSFVAKTNGDVLAHKRSVHEATERAPCNMCAKTFKTRKLLKWHLKHMHTSEGRERYLGYQQKSRERQKRMRSKEKPGNTTSFCTECSIDFLTVHRYLNHKNAVHVAKKWQCELCGKSFARDDVLKRHVRITHSSARPFVCDQCGKDFKSMSNLQTHLYTVHTEEGRLKNTEYYRESRKKRQKVVEALSKAGPLVLNQTQSGETACVKEFRGMEDNKPEFLQIRAGLTGESLE